MCVARPIKSGVEKAVIVSVSMPPAVKQYVLMKGSASKYILSLIYKDMECGNATSVSESVEAVRVKELQLILDHFRKVYLASLKPNQDYVKAEQHRNKVADNISEKYPELTKDVLFSYAQRGKFFNINDLETKDESNESD